MLKVLQQNIWGERMNPQEFMKRWIEGIKNLTPAQQLHAKMTGNLWGTIGLSLAFIVMAKQGLWYWLLFIGAAIYLQFIQYIGARQQYKATVEIMEEMKQSDRNKIF